MKLIKVEITLLKSFVANKYTFVWKGSVEKNKAKLIAKVDGVLKEVEAVLKEESFLKIRVVGDGERLPEHCPDAIQGSLPAAFYVYLRMLTIYFCHVNICFVTSRELCQDY